LVEANRAQVSLPKAPALQRSVQACQVAL
jgi:hypothetical protein